MGSSLSGNYRGAPTAEACWSRVIKVRDLIGGGKGMGLEGERIQSGFHAWTNSYTGEVAELHYWSKIDATDRTGFVRLAYRTRDGKNEARGVKVPLVASTQPFGGLRWWFLCPVTGERVCKLVLPNGGRIFASQRGHGLGYQSQRETPRDRAYRRAWKRRQAMGGKSGVTLDTPMDKPPRRHWRTWDRDEAKMAADVAVCDRYLILSAIKLGALKGDLARRALLHGFAKSR